MEELGPAFFVLDRARQNDPRLENTAIAEAAARLLVHERSADHLGAFSRYALRELCRACIARAEKEGCRGL